MYCPKCGQQQISDAIRYCSRCGFQLNVVTELLATDGVLAMHGTHGQQKLPFLRQKDTRLGAKLIFFSVILAPLAIGLSIAIDSPGPLLIPFVLFLAGLAQIFYALLFGESLLPDRQRSKRQDIPMFEPARSFPVSQGEPVPFLNSKRADTAGIVRPPSVTEHTTQLLDRD
jgi:hypothetical protein